MEFKIEEKSRKEVFARLSIDEDRDLVLHLNDIRVLFLSSRDGSVHLLGLEEEELDKLESLGISNDGSRLIMEDQL